MKILDIPQSGKRGLTVSMNGRYGQVSRTLVIPSNPRTPAQLNVRQLMSTQAAAWRTLTQAAGGGLRTSTPQLLPGPP